jgi:hypothetical protein
MQQDLWRIYREPRNRRQHTFVEEKLGRLLKPYTQWLHGRGRFIFILDVDGGKDVGRAATRLISVAIYEFRKF